ncbi:MAG: hypothetical protein AB1921_04830 [Thermodesulfobacteriota bacterium]
MDPLALTGHGTIIRPEPGKELLACLGMTIELSEDFTFGAFFRTLSENPELVRLNELFGPLVAEHAGSREGPAPDGGPERLEFFKSVELIGYPGRPRVEIYPQLAGFRGAERVDIRFEHVDSLLGLPLGLGKLSHVVFGDRFTEMSFETSYTLFEFLDGMAWELGFMNAPAACAMRR